MKRGVENQGDHPTKKLKLSFQNLNTAIDHALDGQLENLKQLNAELLLSQKFTNNFNSLQYLLFKLSKISKQNRALPFDIEENAVEIINLIFKQLTPGQQYEILRSKTKIGLGILQQLMMTGSEKIFFLFIKPGYIEALSNGLGNFTHDGFGLLNSAIKSGSERIFVHVLTLLENPHYEQALLNNLENFTQDGFGVLQQAINSGSEDIFDKILALLQKRDYEYALRKNLENVTRAGFGVLQHAITSGSEKYFAKILALLQRRRYEHALQINIKNITGNGFGLLQSAIKSGSENIFKQVLDLLTDPSNEKTLRNNLEIITLDGFGVLQQAINSGSISIYKHILTLLQQRGNERALQINLENFNRDGFGALQSAIKSGSKVIFDNILSLLQQRVYKHTLRRNLEQFTKADFGVLHQAIKSCSEIIFEKILELLQQPTYEKALRNNLERFNQDGFGVLQQAIHSGSASIFDKILTLLLKRGYEHTLKLNLESITTDGFGVLQQAINSKSEVIFNAVLALLQQRDYEHALQINLENVTRDGFGILQTAINSGSDRIFEHVISFLQHPKYKNVLRKSLEQFTRDGFGVLQSAIASGSDNIFVKIITLLQQTDYEHALQKNLEKLTRSDFGVLQQAINSRSELFFEKVIILLEQPQYERALRINLENLTRDRFGVLQTAIKSGSDSIFGKVLSILQRSDHERALILNLESFTSAGFGLLQQGMNSGSEDIFMKVLAFLQQQGHEYVLEKNLASFTHDRFGVLQIAIESGSEVIFQEILALLQQSNHEKTLRENLDNVTCDGFGILQSAIKSGSESFFGQILALLQQPSYEHVLQNNLENFTHDGFGVLQNAISQDSESVFNQIVALLQQPGYEHALRNNLERFTRNDFGILQNVIASGSDTRFDTIISLLQQRSYQQALQNNLEGFTSAGFGVLLSSIKSGEINIFRKVLSLLQRPEYKHALQKNLGSVTRDGFGLLHSAINSGSEEIYRKILALLIIQNDKQIIIDNISCYNKHGYNAFWSAIEKLSDIHCSELFNLSQNILSYEQWHILLKSPKNISRFFLGAKKEHFTKIKLFLNALRCALGETEALNIINKAFNRAQLPSKLKEQYKSWLSEIKDNILSSNVDLINRLKKFPFNDDIIDLLQERTLGYSDLVEIDSKGKSLLWCMAGNAAFGNPDFLIHYWAKYHHQFTSDDISRREGEIADGNSVLWYILYAYKKQPNNDNLGEIIRELWQRFPTIFDLKYTPRDSTSERSIASLLNQTQLGKDILLELTRVEERLLLPEPPSRPCLAAGIADKYIFGSTPALPQSVSTVLTANSNTPHSAICLKQCVQSSRQSLMKHFEIEHEVPVFCASFYSSIVSQLSELKTKKVTFVCAGRKDKALVPFPKEGLVIWVLTAEEYLEMKSLIPERHGALVVHKLESEQSGAFHSLELATSRRLAIFLFAHHVALEHFLMLDDNIEKLLLKTTTPSIDNNWDTVYDTIKKYQKNSICVSVQTQGLHNKPPQAGQVGSKLFSFDMEKISHKLNTFEKIFLLLPPATDAGLWGEDYYFQLMLEELFPNQGYSLLPKEDIQLVRSKKNRNAFLANAQHANQTAFATHFSQPTVLEQCLYPERKTVVQKMNRLIDSNIARARAQRQKLEQVDLLAAHANANHQHVAESKVRISIHKQEFKSFIKSINFIPGVLFEHQIQAIQAFSNAHEKTGQIIMATGTGKTVLQCELARIAFQLAYPGQVIIIVTPQLALVDQFYRDFISFSQSVTAVSSFAVPKHAVIKVSSASDSVHVQALLANRRIMQQKSILIFCEKSFKEFLPYINKYNPYLCLLDEFHEYVDTTKDIIKVNSNAFKIGLTATPPPNCFKHEFYRFSISDALNAKRLTSVVIDKIMIDFSTKEIDSLIKALPLLLQRPHPRNSEANKCTKLIDLSGIIYLPSIGDCEKAHEMLQKYKIKSYVIHSQNKHNQQEIEQFKRLPSGVLLACQMLRIGFDHRSLGYVIIAQGVSNDQVLEQIVGRVMRRNGEKLGNVITFQDIAKRVKKITGLLADNENSTINKDYMDLPEIQQIGIFTIKKKTLKKERLDKLLSKETLSDQPIKKQRKLLE